MNHRTQVGPKFRTTPLLFCAAAFLAFGLGSARAQQLAQTSGRILTQDGRVSVEHGGDLWAIMAGQTVTAGQVLVTGPDGYAQVELSDHSVIEVFSNSRLVFRPNPSNWRDLVEIYLGKIRLQIQHLTDGETPYHVTSPTAVISIRGTVLDVEVGPGNDTTIQVETGVIGVRHRLLPGKEVTVQTGQTLRVFPNEPLTALKGTSPLVVAGRIARLAAETVARVGNPVGRSSGSGGGRPTSGGASTAGSAAGTTAGTNQPAPVPGGSGNSGSKGNSGGGTSNGGTGSNGSSNSSNNGISNSGNSAPPGDVIP